LDATKAQIATGLSVNPIGRRVDPLSVSLPLEFVGWCWVEDAREIGEDEDDEDKEDSGEAAAAQVVYHPECIREEIAVRSINDTE